MLPLDDTGLAAADDPPKIFVACCGEVDDNGLLTDFAPKIFAGVLVVGIVLAL